MQKLFGIVTYIITNSMEIWQQFFKKKNVFCIKQSTKSKAKWMVGMVLTSNFKHSLTINSISCLK